MQIGILALQGDYEAHARMLSRLNVDWSYVRSPEELAQVDGLILPGGESSTALNLLQESGLFEAIQAAGRKGMPMFGTCAGAILLAKQVTDPEQPSLGLVDVHIMRNAYGRQLASRITQGPSTLSDTPLPMVFIRAPRFLDLGPTIQIIATHDNHPVCIQQDQFLLATFHPELTEDTKVHEYFVGMMQP